MASRIKRPAAKSQMRPLASHGSSPTPISIEELRRIYEEGIPQKLISGIEVRLHPIQIEKLLEGGDVPDALSNIMLKALYQDVTEELNEFALTERKTQSEAMELIRSIDLVCNAVLLDPGIVPYLSLTDRLWIFKLAFYPAEVLSRFRNEPAFDVVGVDKGQSLPQVA